MPEPTDLDLDAAFDELVRDVQGASRRPGPDIAMRTARRRRGAAVAGATAAVLAVGGVGWNLRPADDDERDISSVLSTTKDLPDPDPFTAQDLARAYGPPWGAGPSPVLTDPICVRAADFKPRTGDSREFRTVSPIARGGLAGAAFTYGQFTDVPAASRSAESITEGWSQCDVAPVEHLLDVGSDASAYVASYPAADGEAARDQLVVQAGDRLALLTVAKEGPGARPLGVDDATRLATAMIAGLLAED